VFDGSYTVKQDIHNDMYFHVSAFNLQGGQYKLMIEKDLGNVCDFVYSEDHKQIYGDLMSHHEPSVPFNTRPFPRGQFTIKNYLIKGINEMIPPYVPGSEKWKALVEYRLNETILGGATFYTTLINDKNMGTLVG
jgi:hypothetical protein